MTDRPVPWNRVFSYLEDLAEAKPVAADYAMTVRTLYEVLVKEGVEPEDVRDFLLFHVPAQHDRGLISKQHRTLALGLLPKPAGRGRGRTKGARGANGYNKNYALLRDWIYEKTTDPSLTQLKFAKARAGVTDEEYKNTSSAHERVDTIVRDLKPTRMKKRLDDGHRRALETIYPLLVAYPQHLARQWREAKECSPALSQQDFLQEFFGWVKHFGRVRTKKELHPIEIEIIDEYLEKLDEGEKLLADSERG